MKLTKQNNKIEIKFMDCFVKLQGNSKNLEQRALKILGSLVQDRIKVHEVMQELDHEDESREIKPKKNKIKYPEYLGAYT